MQSPKVICDEIMVLGEGPLWHPNEKCLYWVDIEAAKLNRIDINDNKIKQLLIPHKIGSIAWRKKGGLIAALTNDLVYINTETGKTETILSPLTYKQKRSVMFNDGKCDRQGRFWVGTKDILEEKPIASLYCLDTSKKIKQMISGFTVSNGIAWSLDNKRMYICDSPKRQIYYYDFNPTNGYLGKCRIFSHIPETEGFPDGLTVDSEDHVWCCHWDGWKITRYKPSGEVDAIISMPIPRPTSCCFGGLDLKTLFVTSASVGLSSSKLMDAPLSGMLFALDVGIKGIAEPPYLG